MKSEVELHFNHILSKIKEVIIGLVEMKKTKIEKDLVNYLASVEHRCNSINIIELMEQVDDDGVDKFTKLLVLFIFKLPDDKNLEDDDIL